MSKKKAVNPMSINRKPEDDSFLLKWPVIVIAIIFAWPIGMVLLITKIIGVARRNRSNKILTDTNVPYSKYKTNKDKLGYKEEKSRRKKRVIATIIMSILFLGLGCIGITRDYIQIFAGDAELSKLVPDFLSHVLFMLVGIYMASSIYGLFGQLDRIGRIINALGDIKSISVEDLAKKTEINDEQLVKDIEYMAERYYFGHDSSFDRDSKTLNCFNSLPANKSIPYGLSL